MKIEVKIIEDSISPLNVRLTTFQLKYPRFIHSEFLRHRVLSRSCASSRALPTIKNIKSIWNDPVIPLYFGKNKSGMQANEELSTINKNISKFFWILGSKIACMFSYIFMKLKLHKQISNRILEPFSYMTEIVTATDWNNFFELRCHKDAQPEFKELADKIKELYQKSIPTCLAYGEWHLPYISDNEHLMESLEDKIKMSIARCARVSYLNHDGTNPDKFKDLELYDKLITSVPMHASPAEHQATPSRMDLYCKNFNSWIMFRYIIELSNKKNIDWKNLI